MTDLPKPTFPQLLDSLGLSPYEPRLRAEGFDDVDTLLDITVDDMVKLGISYDHQKTLQETFTRLRSVLAGPESITDAALPLSSETLVPTPVWTNITSDARLI